MPPRPSLAVFGGLSRIHLVVLCGLAALQVGDDVRAESSLAHATQLAPGEPAAWADWGILALRQRNFDLAAATV